MNMKKYKNYSWNINKKLTAAICHSMKYPINM